MRAPVMLPDGMEVPVDIQRMVGLALAEQTAGDSTSLELTCDVFRSRALLRPGMPSTKINLLSTSCPPSRRVLTVSPSVSRVSSAPIRARHRSPMPVRTYSGSVGRRSAFFAQPHHTLRGRTLRRWAIPHSWQEMDAR